LRRRAIGASEAHSRDGLELATLEYIDWFNHRRLHSACGDRPPAEYETCGVQIQPLGCAGTMLAWQAGVVVVRTLAFVIVLGLVGLGPRRTRSSSSG
jgi:hypothetical protein